MFIISLTPFLLLQSLAQLHLPLHLSPDSPVSNKDDIAYYVEAAFGTPPQPFKLYLSSWTTSTSIPNLLSDCSAKTYFDPSESSTFTPTSTEGVISVLSMQFQEGDSISGYFATDTVSVGGSDSVNDFNFLLAFDCSTSSKISSGVLGLGFKEPQMKDSTLVEWLKKQGVIDYAIFSLYLSNIGFDGGKAQEKESSLIIGGVDVDKYAMNPDKSFNYHSVAVTSEHWYLNLNEVRFGPIRLVNDYNAVIDPGSKYIYGPYTDVSRIYLVMKVSHLCFTNGGVFKCYCGENQYFRTFTFVIDGKDYKISSEWFIENDDGICTVHIYGIMDTRWILGQIFLRKFYSVWDYENKQIGFMRSINSFSSDETSAADWSNVLTIVMTIVLVIVSVSVLVIAFLKNKKYKELKDQQAIETLGIN